MYCDGRILYFIERNKRRYVRMRISPTHFFLMLIIFSLHVPLFANTTERGGLPLLNEPSVLKTDISEFILDDDLKIDTNDLVPCSVFVPPVFFALYFLVEDDGVFYTVAYMRKRIVCIGLDYNRNQTVNQKFKTPEGAYLGMNYKLLKKLRGRKKIVSIQGVGQYVSLKSGWIAYFPSEKSLNESDIVVRLFKTSMIKFE